MEAKEAVEILKKNTSNPDLPEDIKEAIQLLSDDMDRMVPVVPFRGRQGSYTNYNCGFCHTGISNGSKFCYRCGRRVDLEHSDIPAKREEIISDLPKPEEEAVLPKRTKTKGSDMDGQSSIFDLLD